MPTELKSSVFQSNELTEPAATTGLTADIALVRDALSRIEAAARADRAALDQLRGALGTMARTIARAKAAYAIASDSADTTALLDELEHLVDTMMETAGAPAPAAATIEPTSVPTVSAIVSQHGDAAAQDTLAPADAIQDAHEAAVSDLKAMVVAMNAAAADIVAIDAAVPTDAAAAPEVPEQPEALAEHLFQAEPELNAEPEPAAEADLAAEPAAPVDTQAAAQPASAATEVPATATPMPEFGVIEEGELLASFARMEALPIPPPDEGMAVIFPKAAVPESGKPGIVLPAAQDIWELTTPGSNAAAAAAVEPDSPVLRDSTAATDSEAPTGSATAAPAQPPAPLVPPEAEFDPDEFLFGPEARPDPSLFGPESEPEPAAFLLDPTAIVSMPVEIAPLPRPNFASAAAAQEALPQPADAAAMADPSPSPAASSPLAASRIYDPLHALKAMSEWERLALFS